ncbi:hypothetical protein I309_02948 [Cryptococcus deuterogattii LA55]|nr:hypothetical protein I309_02948 [Cryptococcus deuterogattii LA55]KIR91657.1 hypothetical protein I304_04481 [Cryptococcus deuterogattii CBS 10090]KIR99078.1 hypothetical protein L804_03700 [Cryptococcus deuterogattii 2001/935-1]
MVQLRNSMGIVDTYGNVLMESFVRHHSANVVNYITRKPTYEQIQPQIIALIKDKIIVGHTLFNDLAVRPISTASHISNPLTVSGGGPSDDPGYFHDKSGKNMKTGYGEAKMLLHVFPNPRKQSFITAYNPGRIYHIC